jgi:hypothetical protein
MTPKELDAILAAHRRGIEDGFHRGNYHNPYEGGQTYIAYKRGYDAGITMYCEAEGLDKESETED